jgi:hypothetical protein
LTHDPNPHGISVQDASHLGRWQENHRSITATANEAVTIAVTFYLTLIFPQEWGSG